MSEKTPSPRHAKKLLRAVVVTARWVVRLTAVALMLAVLAVCGMAAHIIRQSDIDVHDIPALTDPAKAPLPQPVRFYSADGVLLGRTSTQRRVVLNARQIPDSVRDATVAIEDQRFYDHRGVDLRSLARAAWVDLRAGSARQGASTLTMQYVRNVYLDHEKTTHRKVREVALALQLESMWTKQRILTAYLNTVYYGDGAYGVEAAARSYFGKPASKLTIAQSAMLAGLTQDPNGLNPRLHRAAAKRRQAIVLDEMYAQNMISAAQLRAAKDQQLKLRPRPRNSTPAEPQLMALAAAELRRTVGRRTLLAGGLDVRTSLRLKDIRAARKTLRGMYDNNPKAPVVAASFVQPGTGRVLLVAHSKRAGQFNFATQAQRQPGSIVKAFTAAQWLRTGRQLSDNVDNSPVTVKTGRRTYRVTPTNAGVTTVADALRFSQNPAFWRLYQQAGPKSVLSLERQLGVEGMDANAAAALGGVRVGTNTLQIAGAFAAFAADGRYAKPHVITDIRDRLGNVVHRDRPRTKPVLEREYARQLTVALHDVTRKGFPQLRDSLKITDRRPVAGKTGTSENNADAWFAGYTPQLAGAVWTGYANSRRSLRDTSGAQVFGSTVPASAFSSITARLLEGQPVRRFPKPARVQKIPDVRGLTPQAAQAKLYRFGFASVATRAKFDPDRRSERVLSVSPKPGTWVQPTTPVEITYSVNERPAPNLVGRSYADVVDQLRSFVKISVKLRASDQPTGTVIEQQPYAGQPMKAGSTVTLTLATQRAPAKTVIRKEVYVPKDSELAQLRESRQRMPDVTGLDAEQARQVLSPLGVQVTGPQSGVVLSHSPPAGEPVTARSQVTLNVG